MAINYPKFDQKINDQIMNNKFQETKTRPATIMAYDRATNTATVVLDERYGGTVGDIISKVPCPFSYGVQSVAPHTGMRCIIGFRDEAERDPYIVTFYLDAYDVNKNILNTHVDTGIPKFMV
jgi:hypothetical protein